MEIGEWEGEKCGRKGCKGIIELEPVENCSCHINPPCPACTNQEASCPECGWRSSDDVSMNGFTFNVNRSTGTYEYMRRRKLNPTKIDWHNKSHTHCSMIKEGVYPDGVTKKEVEEKVKGTFGGRFEYFGGGKFKYIAYTD